MRSPILLRSLPLIALLSACSDPAPAANTADVPDAAADVSTTDRPDSGSPDAALDVGPTTLPDVPTADVPRTDVPRTDVPTADVPAADVPTADVPVAQDAPSTDDAPAEECVGRPAACVSGTAGGSCGDALVPPDCVGGSWRCPEGMIPITSCACVGRPPGACTCSPTGWVCPDAGR